MNNIISTADDPLDPDREAAGALLPNQTVDAPAVPVRALEDFVVRCRICAELYTDQGFNPENGKTIIACDCYEDSTPGTPSLFTKAEALDFVNWDGDTFGWPADLVAEHKDRPTIDPDKLQEIRLGRPTKEARRAARLADEAAQREELQKQEPWVQSLHWPYNQEE